MALTSVFGIGILLVAIVLIKKQSLIGIVGHNRYIVKKLSEKRWFHDKWLGGLFLFGLNAVLFSLAVGSIFVSGILNIPYIHILIMFAATFFSIYIWMAIRASVQRPKKDQLVFGFVGSGFYMILFIVFLFMFITLEPSTPEHDTFMAAIGLMFAMIVSAVAWISCFFITGFTKGP